MENQPQSKDYEDHWRVPLIKPEKNRDTNSLLTVHFPTQLHLLLSSAEAEVYTEICSWLPHGRAFLIHDREKFVANVMPLYFRAVRLQPSECISDWTSLLTSIFFLISDKVWFVSTTIEPVWVHTNGAKRKRLRGVLS
jgi:hypothetical protein